MLLWTDSAQRIRDSSLMSRRGYSGSITGWLPTGGRNNGPMNSGSMGAYLTDPAPGDNTFIMGYRFKLPNPYYEWYWQCRLAGAEQCSVRLNAGTGVVFVSRNGTTLASSPAGLIAEGILYYIAVKLVIHPTAGSSIVYLDGVEIPSLTLTNVNTRGQATNNWDSFWVGGFTGGTGGPWCDLYVMDGTKPHADDPNTIITDARIDWCPANGNGYLSNFVGSDGNSTDNYALVDENSPNDDTDYVELTAAGIDAYTLADLPQPGSTIVGVTSFLHSRKTDAGTGIVRTGLRSGGTNYPSPLTKGTGFGYRDFYRCWGHDPGGGAWSEAGFNALEVLAEKV